MAENPETKKAVTYKDILRYVHDSEECKVDSVEGKRLKEAVEKLCLNDDTSKISLQCIILSKGT